MNCYHAYGVSTWLNRPVFVDKERFNPTNDLQCNYCPICGEQLVKNLTIWTDKEVEE